MRVHPGRECASIEGMDGIGVPKRFRPKYKAEWAKRDGFRHLVTSNPISGPPIEEISKRLIQYLTERGCDLSSSDDVFRDNRPRDMRNWHDAPVWCRVLRHPLHESQATGSESCW